MRVQLKASRESSVCGASGTLPGLLATSPINARGHIVKELKKREQGDVMLSQDLVSRKRRLDESHYVIRVEQLHSHLHPANLSAS